MTDRSQRSGRTKFSAGCWILVATWAGCSRPSAPQPPAEPLPDNARLFSVDLQNGFDGSGVTVSVDGKVAYDGKPKTQEVLGFADSFQAVADDDTLTLRLRCQTRNIDITKRIDLNDGNAVGISLVGDDLQIIQRDGGFGYD